MSYIPNTSNSNYLASLCLSPYCPPYLLPQQQRPAYTPAVSLPKSYSQSTANVGYNGSTSTSAIAQGWGAPASAQAQAFGGQYNNPYQISYNPYGGGYGMGNPYQPISNPYQQNPYMGVGNSNNYLSQLLGQLGGLFGGGGLTQYPPIAQPAVSQPPVSQPSGGTNGLPTNLASLLQSLLGGIA